MLQLSILPVGSKSGGEKSAAGIWIVAARSGIFPEVSCDAMESPPDGCICDSVPFSRRAEWPGSAISGKYVPGDALAHDRADSRRAGPPPLPDAPPTQSFLHCGG